MIDFGVTIGSLELIPSLPKNVGFKLWPRNFDSFDAQVGLIEKLPPSFLEKGSYLGCSSLFNAGGDCAQVTRSKTERLDSAIKVHNTLCSFSGESVPFALVTEPIWRRDKLINVGEFGTWTYTQRAGERIAKTCLDYGLDWISISQNRITSDEIAEKTIEMGSWIQCHGVEVTIGWQCWPGWGSTECISLVQRRVQQASEQGLSSSLAEIGFRYSRFVSESKEGLAMAQLEENYCLGRTADWIDSQLDSTELQPTWWQDNFEKKKQANLIMPRQSISGIDLRVLNALDC